MDSKEKDYLTKDEMKMFFKCSDGATIFNRHIAELFRKIQKFDSELIIIIDDMKELSKIVGKKNIKNEDGELAYFGVKATEKGEKFIEDYCKKNHYIWHLEG
jgi:hypothetical protein